jgi:hypothetical protein
MLYVLLLQYQFILLILLFGVQICLDFVVSLDIMFIPPFVFFHVALYLHIVGVTISLLWSKFVCPFVKSLCSVG